jgi:hypothetical protein
MLLVNHCCSSLPLVTATYHCCPSLLRSIQCTICRDLLDGETTELGCVHVDFHFECIMHWSKIITTCPLCRTPFTALTKHIKDLPHSSCSAVVTQKLFQSIPEGYLEEDHPEGFVLYVRQWNKHQILASDTEKEVLLESMKAVRAAAREASGDPLSHYRLMPLDEWTAHDFNSYMALYRPTFGFVDLIQYKGHYFNPCCCLPLLLDPPNLRFVSLALYGWSLAVL